MDRLKLAIESMQTHIDYDNRANGMQTGIITIGIAEAEALLELLKEQEHKDKMFHALEEDWKRLKEQPQIVRCKDCAYALFKEGVVQHGHIVCTKPFTERWQVVKPNDWYCADWECKEKTNRSEFPNSCD